MLLPRFSNFSSTISVNNILKARRAFLSLGSIFQISCQSHKSPVNLGIYWNLCEVGFVIWLSWTITDSILDQLERFQCEIRKRTVRVPHIFNNLVKFDGLAHDFPLCRQKLLLQSCLLIRTCFPKVYFHYYSYQHFPLFKNAIASDWKKSGEQSSPPR